MNFQIPNNKKPRSAGFFVVVAEALQA